VVLIDTLREMRRALPRSAEGGLLNRNDISRRLPPIFVAWFCLVLGPFLKAQPGGVGSQREGRTLVEAFGQLLAGGVLQGIMILLGRPKAITQASQPEGGGWQVARHHELVRPDSSGILTAQDRDNAAMDQREELRTLGYSRGSAMPSRQGRAGQDA
jgi:hypothetical protein